MVIGILQAGEVPPELLAQHGDYNTMIERLLTAHNPDFTFRTFSLLDNQFPQSAVECEGWLISGSRHSCYEALPWIVKLKTLIREIAESGRPLVGICFGHQIIADALGGRVTRSEKGWGLGLDTYTLSAHSPISPQSCLTLNVFHQDQVVALPPSARSIAGSPFCQNAGFLIDNQILTIQAHPEFSTRYNYQLVKVRKGTLLSNTLADKAMAQLKEQSHKVDSSHLGEGMSHFFTKRMR